MLFTALALFAGLLASPPPASATITNVQPFDGQQDPISGDEVFDNEEIWAYVTSPTGGVVCIERYSDSPGTCKSDFAYAETPVLPFYAGFVPIAPGDLLSGPMMLVAAEGLGEPVTAVSEGFFVRPCTSGCPVANFGPTQEFKTASNALLASLKDMCGKMQALSMLWRTKQLYAEAEAIVDGYSGGLAGGTIISVGVTAGSAAYDFVKGDDLTSKLPGNLSVIADMTCKAAELVDKVKENTWVQYGSRWAGDPPDGGYSEVATPRFVDFESILGYPSYGFDGERDTLDGLRAYGEASLHGWERYQGAAADANPSGEHTQARATSDNLLGYAARLRKGSRILKSLAGRIRSEIPDAAQRTITQADLDKADAYVDHLQSGFSPAEIANLEQLGIHATGIARFLVNQTLWDPSDATPGLLDASLDNLGDDMVALADDAEAFARAAGVVAGRNALPINASFAGVQLTDPLDVDFTDATGNPGQDPLSVTWDFGDGSTGTGPRIKHHYATRGTYTVTETVSNDYETDTFSAPQAAGDPNRRPIAAFTATPESGTVPLTVHFDGSGSSDPDGTIASYDWSFGDGDHATGVTVDHEFTAPASQPYRVTLTVTDDLSATGATSKGILVEPPPTAPETTGDTMAANPEAFLDVLANDMDANVELLTVASTGPAEHGSVSCQSNGVCHYVAEPGYEGPDQFTYVARDPGGLETTAEVTVTATAPAQSTEPVPADDETATGAGHQVAVDVLANDAGAGALVFQSAGPAQHGTVGCSAAGVCTYAPAAGFTGHDGFIYTMTDATQTAQTAQVHVTVLPADAKYGLRVSGAPDPLESGQSAHWQIGVTGATSELPAVATALTGAHVREPGSTSTAAGWAEAAGGGAKAGPDALLGESLSVPLVKPVATISMGTGGDGHVPILVGDRVFAFFHHAFPTSVSCINRRTNRRCPGYPVPIGLGTSDIPGPGVVIGDRIYLQLRPAAAFTQAASLGVYCWDTTTARPCGFTLVDRVLGPTNRVTSTVVQAAGKLYFAADTGRLYCLVPATMASCGSLATGLSDMTSAVSSFDILVHGTRIFISNSEAGLTCLDVDTRLTCAGWTLPRDTGGFANLINRHAPNGSVNGLCLLKSGSAECFADDSPGTATVLTKVPPTEEYFSISEEAETGTRTIFGAHGIIGVACFDWVTLAPCSGAGYSNSAAGQLTRDVDGADLPEAYGAAFDGACVVALGDPGLVFTVDPRGYAPCSGLAGARRIDLRDQRCDAGVGGATWDAAQLVDDGQGELAAVRVIVRDAASGDVLATKNLLAGELDLSGVDAAAHPAVTLALAVIALPGSMAWDDAIPPRITVRWHADPAQLCFQTSTQAACAVAPIGVTATLPDATEDRQVELRPVACPSPTPAPPQPTPTQAPVSVAARPAPAPVPPGGATEAVLACSHRRVVLEDVFASGGRVHLLGVADRSLAGQEVRLIFAPTGKAVAVARVGADGRFEASAPLPPRALRTSSRARYRARLGTEESLNLKLVRRMIVTSISSVAGKLKIAGRITGPLALRVRDRAISVQRIVACKKVEHVTTIQPGAGGAFRVTLAAPRGQAAAVYRLATKVRPSARSKVLVSTFTLPRAVEFP